MDPFEQYAHRVTNPLDLPSQTKRRVAEEVVVHLQDEMQQRLGEGLGNQEATDQAIARFGEGNVIAQLVAAAMAQEQKRFRRRRLLLSGIVVSFLTLLAVGIGAWFNFFDDAVSRVGVLPYWVWWTVYTVVGAGCTVALVAIAARLFHSRATDVVVSGLCVMVAMYISLRAFRSTPLLGKTIGFIYAGEAVYVTAVKSFAMRLYLCWVPTLLIGGISLAMTRDRKRLVWLAVLLGIGMISAVLWGVRLLSLVWPWLMPLKWPKLLSTGLWALLVVLMTGVLAQSIGHLRARHVSREENPIPG